MMQAMCCVLSSNIQTQSDAGIETQFVFLHSQHIVSVLASGQENSSQDNIVLVVLTDTTHARAQRHNYCEPHVNYFY